MSQFEEQSGCYNGMWCGSGDIIRTINPSTGKTLASIRSTTKEEYEATLQQMVQGQSIWQSTPAPKRGEIVRQIGEELRAHKEELAQLICKEMGKIYPEALGEVQEFIDVCDYAVGLSRQLNGSIMPSERSDHILIERYNPLGLVAIITAFNFPLAVCGWNLAISLICGNVNLWKPASTTSLIAIETTKLIEKVLQRNNIPGAVCSLVTGSGRTVGEWIINDHRFGLISFTGSTSVGTKIATSICNRFGRTILELGGNNAIVVMEDADLDLALRATVFSAIGTTGQRCTTVRRLLLHENIYDTFLDKLIKVYTDILPRIGDPLKDGILMGPLHTQTSVKEYLDGLHRIQKEGGKIIFGGKHINGNFVEPTLVEIHHDAEIVKEELFCPILYVIKFKTLEEAISINNEVPQGLSSSLFTQNMQNVFIWSSERGSDCGLVNVNVGTSGAEIGGAFGGSKASGHGTEAGSDSWKQYCKRSTITLNYSSKLPLSQGISFN